MPPPPQTTAGGSTFDKSESGADSADLAREEFGVTNVAPRVQRSWRRSIPLHDADDLLSEDGRHDGQYVLHSVACVYID